ncbi:MAG: EpsG family protein, partial [Ruminococcus sp.]|nr:EpsG family protein [Ruminococcus sp.]
YWSSLILPLVMFVFTGMYKTKYRRELVDDKDVIGRNTPIIIILIMFGYYAFWACANNAVGDIGGYLQGFDNLSVNSSSVKSIFQGDSKGKLFALYRLLFKKYISTDAQLWLTSIQVFCGLVLSIVIYKYSENAYISAFYFIASGYFTSWPLNGLRQYVAMILVFAATKLMVENKLLPFILIFTVAVMIHSTALIFVPLYLIAREKPWSKRIWIYIIFTLVVVFFIDNFTNLLESGLEGTEYEGGTVQFEHDDGANPIRTLVACVPVGIAILYRKKIEEMNNPYIFAWVNFSTAAVGMLLVANLTSGILIGRFASYASIYHLLLYPVLFTKVIDKKYRPVLFMLFAALFVLYFKTECGDMVYSSDLTGYIK